MQNMFEWLGLGVPKAFVAARAQNKFSTAKKDDLAIEGNELARL